MSLIGERALHNRMESVAKVAGEPLLRRLAISAVAKQKQLVHRRTGHTGRTIRVGQVSATNAQTVVGGAGPFLEYGTRPHVIRPRNKKVLRFAANASGARLTGSPRKGAAVVFARRVRHPGTKPYPFMLPGAKAAVEEAGLSADIIRAWNEGA